MEKYAVPNKLPSKQVTVLTHRKKRINQQQQTLKKKPQRKIVNANSGEQFKKPEFFVAVYRKAERDDKRIKRELMKHGLQRKHMKDGELVVVLRHRGNISISYNKFRINAILVSGTHIASEQCINLLNQIGLRRMHQAVFLRFTADVKAVLGLVEPYVIYGTPDVISVRDLIFKYGFIKHKGKKTSISSNTVIEEIFGDSGIICVEDLVSEVVTVGPSFDKVTKAIYPFVLPNPKDGWIGKKGLSFEKGGIAGYRGKGLNEMLKKIL